MFNESLPWGFIADIGPVEGGPEILRPGVANDVDLERDDWVRGRETWLNAGEAGLVFSGLRRPVAEIG